MVTSNQVRIFKVKEYNPKKISTGYYMGMKVKPKVENVITKGEDIHSDKGYVLGSLEDAEAFSKKRNYDYKEE